MANTLQAVREALYSALTSPALQYLKDTGSAYTTLTLPAANVVPGSAWINSDTPPPTPYIRFSVKGNGMISRTRADRKFKAMIWVFADDEDTATMLYEAVRARINLSDPEGVDVLSRAGGSHQFSLAVRECIERTAWPADFDKTTARWQLVAEYDLVAV